MWQFIGHWVIPMDLLQKRKDNHKIQSVHKYDKKTAKPDSPTYITMISSPTTYKRKPLPDGAEEEDEMLEDFIYVDPMSCLPKELQGGKENMLDIFYIRSRLNGMFLTVRSKGECSPVVTWSFTGTAQQMWVYKDGSFFWCGDLKKAMDVESGGFFDSTKNIVVRSYMGPLRNSHLFKIDKENSRIVSMDKRYQPMCFDIKGASTGKGASIILWTPKAQSNSNQQFDIIRKDTREIESLDDYESSKKMGGYNKSQCLKKGDHKIFFKPHKTEKTILLESGGSEMTHYITGGLVPLSKRASFQNYLGIYQPFVTMDESGFKNLKIDNYIADLSFLNQKQIHQLFTHMVADRLISNWDTHNEQFAIDEHGNLISFDKEKAFYLFNLSNSKLQTSLSLTEDYRRLNFHVNLWKNPIMMAHYGLYFIYSSLCHHIKNQTITIDPDSIEIQEMLKRCEEITPEFVRKCLGDYSLIKFHSSGSEEFLDIVYRRIKNIRKPLYHYFKWPNPPANIDHDPWILD